MNNVRNGSAPRALFYLRVSTDDQSVEQQRPTLDAYFAFALSPKGFEKGPEFVDEGVSASMPFLSRPGGQRCSLAADRGDCIVIAKLDRAFRNVRDCLAVVDTLAKRGVTFHLLDVPVIDLGSAVGRCCLTMIAAFAEFERGRMCERMRDCYKSRMRRGLAYGGKPRYGFRIAGPKGLKRHVPWPEVRAYGSAIVHWREQGWTWEAIWRHCVENRIRDPRSGNFTRPEAIEDIYHAELRLRATEEKRNGSAPT